MSKRIREVLKNAFMENSYQVDYESESVKVTGYIGSSTFISGNANNCYFFVNGRFVRDRSLLSFIRLAYGDLLEKSGFPSAILFINVPSEDIDVNVHPSKMEIKFKKLDLIRTCLKTAVRNSLNVERFNARSHLSKQAYSYFRKDSSFKNNQRTDFSRLRRENLDQEETLNLATRVDPKDDITHKIKYAQSPDNNRLGLSLIHI